MCVCLLLLLFQDWQVHSVCTESTVSVFLLLFLLFLEVLEGGWHKAKGLGRPGVVYSFDSLHEHSGSFWKSYSLFWTQSPNHHNFQIIFRNVSVKHKAIFSANMLRLSWRPLKHRINILSITLMDFKVSAELWIFFFRHIKIQYTPLYTNLQLPVRVTDFLNCFLSFTLIYFLFTASLYLLAGHTRTRRKFLMQIPVLPSTRVSSR